MHVFLKEMALYLLPAKFFQDPADVLACKVRIRECKVRIAPFVPYLGMAACSFACQQPVEDQGKERVAFIRQCVQHAVVERLPGEVFLQEPCIPKVQYQSLGSGTTDSDGRAGSGASLRPSPRTY